MVRFCNLKRCSSNHSRNRSCRLASEKLLRWGFHPKRRCLLPVVCDQLLIRSPGCPDEVFPGVDFRDRMHGLCIFVHRQICTCLVDMKLPKRTCLLLDRRLVSIGRKRVLHDSSTGRTYRVQRTLFSEANLSATDRICTLFLLPHVIGHRALEFPPEIREPLLTAIALAQIFAIATHGCRALNEREIIEIFDRGWTTFFGTLEMIHQIAFESKYNPRLQKHHRNPDKYQAPKVFEQANR